MKLRNWAIVVVFLLVAAASAFYEVKLYLEKKKQLEFLVVQAVSPYINGTFDVGAIRFGFFSAHLRDVQLALPAQAIGVSVDHITVRFSAIRLVSSRFSITRSVKSIVLSGPTIEYSFAPGANGRAGTPLPKTVKPAPRAGKPPPRELMVEYLQVRKGVFCIRDRSGRKIVLGEHLEGRLWDTGAQLEYDLSGRLGALENNLFVHGRISWTGEKHRLAMRLESAEIRQPVALRDVLVSAGTLSGMLDVAFPDSFSMAGLESNGWIGIAGGTCRIDTLKTTLENVNFRLSVADNRLSLDSLSGRYACMDIRAAGTWDLAGRQELDRIEVECRNLCIDSAGVSLPRAISSAVAGNGWLRAAVERRKGSDVRVAVRGGGVTLWGVPLLGIAGSVTLQNRLLSIDSLSVRSPTLRLQGAGVVDYSRKPLAYSFEVSGGADSLALVHPSLGGTLDLACSITGIGNQQNGKIVAQAKNLQFTGFLLGNTTIEAKARGDSMVVFLRNSDRHSAIKGSAVLRDPLSKNPGALCSLAVRIHAGHPLLVRKDRNTMPFMPDSLRMNTVISGWTGAFASRTVADVFSPSIKGTLVLHADRPAGKERPVVLKLEQRNLLANGFPLACAGAGRAYPDSVMIDSLAFFNQAVAAGKIILSDPVRLDARCRYDCALRDVFNVFGKKEVALESGSVSGTVRCYGPLDKVETRAEVHIRDVSIASFGRLQSDAIITASGNRVMVLPLVVRKDKQVVLVVDTISNKPKLRLSGRFDDLDLGVVFGALFPEGFSLKGRVTGSFRSTQEGLPVAIDLSSPLIGVNRWSLDSVKTGVAVDSSGIRVMSLRATDGSRTMISGSGFLPWRLLQGEELESDMVDITVAARGDILATLHRNLHKQIDGDGQGTLRLSISRRKEEWRVKEASLLIPKGTLILKPFVPDGVKNFSCLMSITDSTRVSTVVSGTIRKRPVRIFSTHQVPQGYEPIVIGPVSFGVLQAETPESGIDIHLPGFMEKKQTGDIEPAGRPPFRYFTLSGPVQRPVVSGAVFLRDLEFTFPFLPKEEEEEPVSQRQAGGGGVSASAHAHHPLSYVRWELDVRAADRKVMYFRDIANKKTRIMRFLEGYIDQGNSLLRVRGCDLESTLKITGIIHSYRGAVYYGKTFDRNFEAHLEFVPEKKPGIRGYDNLPIVSGRAEAFADTSRFSRITLTAMIQDPATGGVSERGRLNGKRLNVIFHLSSDFEELPGESEREFYRQAGLQFTTLGSAGRFMSDFGEQYLHRYFLQRFERRLAKSMGLDVINIETSFASNYFNRIYNRQIDNMITAADYYYALANVGVTVGRYFFRDNLFIKARGGLLPVDMELTPQYSFGFEFQPSRFLFLDMDYGFYKGEMAIEHNPRVNLQLRLPITGLRNYFDF